MNIEERLNRVVERKVVKDEVRLKRHQEYYKKLSKEGLIQKQTYNLKPISAI